MVVNLKLIECFIVENNGKVVLGCLLENVLSVF